MNSILFLLRSFSLGGAQRQLCVLAQGLKQSGYSVKVAVFYAGGPLEAEAREMGIQIVDLKRRGRLDLLPFFFRLVNLVKRENPDILHSYLQVSNIWSAIVKLVLPRIKVVWGIRASNMAVEKYDWQWQLTDKAESLLAKIPDWIICNSQAGVVYYAGKGYPKEKMSMIHNGINTEGFFPDLKLGRLLRKQWGVQDNQKLIGMAARIDPKKDYPNFLQASSLLVKERKDLRFVCIGDGPDKLIQEYRDLARALNLEQVLTWAGKQEDMIGVYNALDVLVLSSAYGEGFPNVIGEAMACSVPCVATDVGDSAQLIGSLGEIVPPQDPEALKRGILTLLNQFEKNGTNLGKEIRQRIIERFSVSGLVSRTAELLNEVYITQRV
jgi:glycosyltransferase involved in cell wall biosynthesis